MGGRSNGGKRGKEKVKNHSRVTMHMEVQLSMDVGQQTEKPSLWTAGASCRRGMAQGGCKDSKGAKTRKHENDMVKTSDSGSFASWTVS